VKYFPAAATKLLGLGITSEQVKQTKSAAVQATDERPIAPPYSRQISDHPAFSSSGQKDDSHWMHFTVNSMCFVL